MSKKIFWNIVLVSMAVFIAVLGISIATLYDGYSDPYLDTMRNELNTLAKSLDLCGRDFLTDLEYDHPITLVEPDGTVAFNSEGVGVGQNLANAPDIQQALSGEIGYCEEDTPLFTQEIVFIATRLQDGSVLRLSGHQHTAFSLLAEIAPYMAITLLTTVLISILLASRSSRSITAPINHIDLEHPERTPVYTELTPLVRRISEQNRHISRQMEQMRCEHERQDAIRRDFTANVSHELKTPLTSISGYAEIIKHGIARDEDIPRFAGKIYDESQRLIALVGDIIKLSQLDDKEIAVPMEEIDLHETCAAILAQLELPAKEREVTLSLSGEHIKIRCAAQIAEEVIFNLCDNAVKYNRRGGSVSVSIRQCMDGVELTVADTGIGISKTDLPHIFERFYRVDKSHSRQIGGTGLGLSIVKHGVKFLGANLSVESEVDKGTIIRVVF